ncbi:MAG: hypothetical protein AAGA66_07985 [Bacteroidota bacterium]
MTRVKTSFEDVLEASDYITVRLRRNGTLRSIVADALDGNGEKVEYTYLMNPDYSWIEITLYLEVVFRMVEEEAKRWSLRKTLGIPLKGSGDGDDPFPLNVLMITLLITAYFLIPP